MLVIGLLKNIQQAVINYRSRQQLKQLSNDGLKDIALSYCVAIEEGRKANALVFLKESLFSPLNYDEKREK